MVYVKITVTRYFILMIYLRETLLLTARNDGFLNISTVAYYKHRNSTDVTVLIFLLDKINCWLFNQWVPDYEIVIWKW